MNEDGYENFARARQRRLELNNEYIALRSLVPNPTQPTRVSVLRDAIGYIHELEGTVNELKLLVAENKIIESSNADGTKFTCQLCNKDGHLASHCDLRFDENFNNPNAISANGSRGTTKTVNDPE